jgi:hypothetical protein
MADAGEIAVRLTLKTSELEAALNGASRQFTGFGAKLRDLGAEARDLFSNKLTQALSLGALAVGIRGAFKATDELEQSQRTLASTAQITGASLDSLYATANALRTGFQLDDDMANKFTETVTRLTAASGQLNQTQQVSAAFLELGAARGFTATQTMEALENAFIGVYRGAQKLIGQNVGDLFARVAQASGRTAAELTEAEKAQILVNAALDNGSRAAGSYAAWLETAAGKQQSMNLALNEAQVALGKALAPIRLAAIPALAAVLTKVREFIGGIQLLAAEFAIASFKIEAFWKDFKAFAFDAIASALTQVDLFFRQFGIGIGEFGRRIASELQLVASVLRKEADALRAVARVGGPTALAEAEGEIIGDFNQPPAGGGGPPGRRPPPPLGPPGKDLLGPFFEEGAKVIDATRTATERFNVEMARLNILLSVGAINQTTYDRAVQQLNEDLGPLGLAAAALAPYFEEGNQIIAATRTASEAYGIEVTRLNALLSIGAINLDTYTRALKLLRDEMGMTLDVGSLLADGLAYAFETLGQAIGKSLAGANFEFRHIGHLIINVLGELLQTVGQTMIGFGTAMLALKLSISNPFAAIAAGIALVALGSMLSQSVAGQLSHAGGGGGGGGGGGAAEPRGAATGAGLQQTIILEFRDPTSDAVTKRIVASVNRLHSRDGAAVVAVPAAVMGV